MIADDSAWQTLRVEAERTSEDLGVHIARLVTAETADAWARFRIRSKELGLTLGAYVGQLAEVESHRLGWRAESSD